MMQTSQSANRHSRSPIRHIHIRSDGVWSDDSHRVSDYLQADETLTCRALAEKDERGESDWTTTNFEDRAMFLASRFVSLHEKWFDVAAVAALVEALPDGANLFWATVCRSAMWTSSPDPA